MGVRFLSILILNCVFSAGVPLAPARAACIDSCYISWGPASPACQTSGCSAQLQSCLDNCNRQTASYGAIAYNMGSGAYAPSHGRPSRADAEAAALSSCGAGCKIMNWESDSCIALAGNSSRDWAVSDPYSSEGSAERAAISSCGQTCKVLTWACR
jgi:hypothetical protein